MNANLVILAGGMSSRMKKPSTSKRINQIEENEANNRSKSLISVGKGGRPLLDYLLYNAKKSGYKNVYLVINKQGKLFQEYYGLQLQNNTFHELNISFVIQHIPENRVKPLGTADAVFQTLEQYPHLKNETFTVCNSDNLYSINALSILIKAAENNAFISYDRASLEFTMDKILSFAIVNLDTQNYLKNIVEKPSQEEAENSRDAAHKIRVSMNIFKLKGDQIYPFLKNCPIHPIRNEKELPTAILNMIQNKSAKVLGLPLSEHVPDLTAKDDIHIIKDYLQKHYPTALDW